MSIRDDLSGRAALVRRRAWDAGGLVLVALGIGGVIFLAKSWQLHRRPTKRNAMANFLASLLQLTLLIVGVLLDGAIGFWS